MANYYSMRFQIPETISPGLARSRFFWVRDSMFHRFRAQVGVRAVRREAEEISRRIHRSAGPFTADLPGRVRL